VTEERLIDPQWLREARKRRLQFICRVGLVFLVLSVLAWWALPRLLAAAEEVNRATAGTGAPVPASVSILVWAAGWFKAFWAVIGLGCAGAVALALTGKMDTLLRVLNIAVLLVGLAAVAMTFYVFYAPVLVAIDKLR
jgi:hypothetical protein